MKGSPHHPQTAHARERHVIQGSAEPRYRKGWSDRFATQGRSGAATRQRPRRQHPDCHTSKPVFGILARWKRENVPTHLVRTKLRDSDPVVAAAAYRYLKLKGIDPNQVKVMK